MVTIFIFIYEIIKYIITYMKTLKEYIIKEDLEDDVEQQKNQRRFFLSNENMLKEKFDLLVINKPENITDWFNEAIYNYNKNTDSDEVYFGRDLFDDVTGQWFKYSNMYLIALNGNVTKDIIKDECGKDASTIMSRVCLAYLYDGQCKIAIYTIDKLDKGARVYKHRDLSSKMKYDYNKSFGENITHFIDEVKIIGKYISKYKNKIKKDTVENPAENAAKEHTDEIKNELKTLGLDKEIFQKVANKLANLVLSESINEARISAKEVRQMVGQMREKDKKHIDMVLTNLFLIWEKIKTLGLKSPDNVRALLSAYEKSPEEKPTK